MAKYVNKQFKEIITFIFIGGITTIINFMLLALFYEIFKINPIISNIISYLIATIISYFANAIVTFKHSIKNSKKELNNLLKYCIMKLLFLVLDTICLSILLKVKLNLYFSKLILTIIFTIGSYSISRWIVGENKNNDN